MTPTPPGNAGLRTEIEALTKRNASLEQRDVRRTLELEESIKELEGFAYSVSHDLRAPLRHVDGYVRLLSERAGGLDGDSLHYIEMIRDSVKKMSEVMDHLLAYSRLGRQMIEIETVSLNDLVSDLVREFSADIAGRPVVWNVQPLPDVRCDRYMLRIVFTNLLGNALKFSRARTPARIEIREETREGDYATVLFRDNGVGFDMQFADNLFGVLQRLHRQEEFEGHGVGLAYARRILHRHGGRIWAKGTLNVGADFYVSLPLRNP